MRFVAAREPGPPEVLAVAEAQVPAPKRGDVLIRVAYAGVNRPDCLQRAEAIRRHRMRRRSSGSKSPGRSSRWARTSMRGASVMSCAH